MSDKIISLPPELNITGITSDSRKVKAGMLFAAIKGSVTDGRNYINDALSKGAIAILAPEATVLPADSKAYLITSNNCRKSLSSIAATYYKSQPENIVAVTGTNGKSSTVFFASQIASLIGFNSVSMGTLGIHGKEISRQGTMTTLDPVELHKNLDMLATKNINFVAMEASSHGISQHRLDNVKLKAAAFTNLSREHLDYHGSMEEYFLAKSRLFSEILEEGTNAILNADIPEYEILSKICKSRNIEIIDYGYNAKYIKIIDVIPINTGQIVKLEIFGKIYDTKISQIGKFQLMNILAAMALVISIAKHDITKQIIEILPKLHSPTGRMQLISGHPKGATIYVDYAHTPDALENVIQATRPHVEGKLVCIIGCGGDRDSGKRPIMGSIAAKNADIVIITDDNPRSEDPQKIRSAMLSDIPKELSSSLLEIGNRKEAIRKGIEILEHGDVLIIAGKGHEQGQIIGSETLPFDDVQEAQSNISILNNNNRTLQK